MYWSLGHCTTSKDNRLWFWSTGSDYSRPVRSCTPLNDHGLFLSDDSLTVVAPALWALDQAHGGRSPTL
uniref:Uncharacterized protein n=1 Tax=Anguilla anguilla TaxID=7936 RepID=A0A0E9S7J8_ANGAN